MKRGMLEISYPDPKICTDRAPKWSFPKAHESFNFFRPLRESFGEAFKWVRSLARRTVPGIVFTGGIIEAKVVFLVFVLVVLSVRKKVITEFSENSVPRVCKC